MLLSFNFTSSSTLVDSLINMHNLGLETTSSNLPFSPCSFGLSYSVTVSRATENICHCRLLYAGHGKCSNNLNNEFLMGFFSCLHGSIRFPSNEAAAVGLLQVSVLSIFLWDSINLSLMLRLISVISKSPIECNWVDLGHSSDFQLMYRIICYR